MEEKDSGSTRSERRSRAGLDPTGVVDKTEEDEIVYYLPRPMNMSVYCINVYINFVLILILNFTRTQITLFLGTP